MPCMIGDDRNVYMLMHGGKEFGLEKVRLNQAGEVDWTTAELVDWVRLPLEEDRYLKVILAILIMLERMQKDRPAV